MKLGLWNMSTRPRPDGPSTSSATPVAKTATVEATTTGASSRRGRSGGALLPVLARAPVVAREAPARAGELQRHRRNEQHPDEDVRREQLPDREDGYALGREQQEEDGARCRRHALVAVRSPTQRSPCSARN